MFKIIIYAIMTAVLLVSIIIIGSEIMKDSAYQYLKVTAISSKPETTGLFQTYNEDWMLGVRIKYNRNEIIIEFDNGYIERLDRTTWQIVTKEKGE